MIGTGNFSHSHHTCRESSHGGRSVELSLCFPGPIFSGPRIYTFSASAGFRVASLDCTDSRTCLAAQESGKPLLWICPILPRVVPIAQDLPDSPPCSHSLSYHLLCWHGSGSPIPGASPLVPARRSHRVWKRETLQQGVRKEEVICCSQASAVTALRPSTH